MKSWGNYLRGGAMICVLLLTGCVALCGCSGSDTRDVPLVGRWLLDATLTRATAHDRYRRAKAAGVDLAADAGLSLDEELNAVLSALDANKAHEVYLVIEPGGMACLVRAGTVGPPRTEVLASGVVENTGGSWFLQWTPLRKNEGPASVLLSQNRLELIGVAAKQSRLGLVFTRWGEAGTPFEPCPR